MILKEMQLLSEGLWASVKSNLKFFSSIQTFVRSLAEFPFSELDSSNINELKLYIEKIEEFFDRYRPTGSVLYIPPSETSSNDKTVRRLNDLFSQLAKLSEEELTNEIEHIAPKQRQKKVGGGAIFIGHGRNKLWARVQVFLQDELGLDVVTYESENHTSESITDVLDGFLDKASYAILVMTAEDETAEGKSRARQNVIHEAGLFQGRLGFDKVIILKQDVAEEFTNIAGLQYIGFADDNIEQCFYELQRVLKKHGLVK